MNGQYDRMTRPEVEELIEGIPDDFRTQIEQTIYSFLLLGFNFQDASEHACAVLSEAYDGFDLKPDQQKMMRLSILSVAWLMCDNYQKRLSAGSN